jgi:spore coat protein JB
MNNTLFKLTQLDFSAIDLQLYLDIHPDDKKAIAEYNKTVGEAAKLRAEYEQKNGALTARASSDPNKFKWIDDPWDWEETYN